MKTAKLAHESTFYIAKHHNLSQAPPFNLKPSFSICLLRRNINIPEFPGPFVTSLAIEISNNTIYEMSTPSPPSRPINTARERRR